MWQLLRREVEERSAPVRVTARIRRDRLDLAVRILGAALTGPPRTGDTEDGATGGSGTAGEAADDTWVTVELAYPVLRAVRQLLQFGDSLEVLDPPEARQVLAHAAAEVTALYAADDASPVPGVAPEG